MAEETKMALEEKEDALLMLIDSEEDEVGVQAAGSADEVKQIQNDLQNLGSKDALDSLTQEEAPTEKLDELEPITEQPEPQAEEAATEEPQGDLEKALSALRRAKTPQKVLDNLSPEEILSWGADAAKIQADYDDTYRRHSELQKQNGQTEDETPTELDEPSSQPERVNLSDAYQSFNDEFGEDAAKALQGAIDPRFNDIDSSMKKMFSLVGSMIERDVRGQLEGRFPQLGDDDVFARVRDKASGLIDSGQYQGQPDFMVAAFADAAKILLSDDDGNELASRRQQDSRKRSQGQMTSTSRRSAPETLSNSDRDDIALDILEQGGSVDDARRAAGY